MVKTKATKKKDVQSLICQRKDKSWSQNYKKKRKVEAKAMIQKKIRDKIAKNIKTSP